MLPLCLKQLKKNKMKQIQRRTLNELQPGEQAVIVKVLGYGAFRKRITEMGFVRGKTVSVVKKAPLLDPVEYKLMNYHVSLRNSEAKLIEIVSKEDIADYQNQSFQGTIDDETLKVTAIEKGKNINAVLVGNPNCGKTTIFNYASGSHERVGNYSGVTVDAKEGKLKKNDYTINLVDLPGTYSITEYTPEELYVRNYITNSLPDIVINVVDASNLDRNLYLTTQLIDMNIKVIIALNMFDELENSGVVFDYEALGKMLGIPIIPTIAAKGEGIDDLIEKVIDVYEDKDFSVRHIHINYGSMIESSIRNIQRELWKNQDINTQISSRYLAIKLLETDQMILKSLSEYANFEKIKSVVDKEISILENEYGEKSETIITDAKYGFIDGALKETRTFKTEEKTRKINHLDDILTHRYLGFPIFLLFLFLIFEATFTLGQYPMDWIESGVEWLSQYLNTTINEGPLKDLLIDGIISGVGGVIVFLPNILILFFCISLLEDTGYMARAAFLMDKIMHKMGLHGKSFIPLIMGFGCNVPAILATRTLESKKDRILTMIITPLMSCSARLPVYVLLISAFFSQYQSLVLFSIYGIGVLLAVVVALFMKKIAFKEKDVPFVMELPPYRIPTLKSTLTHMWHKGEQYLKKMGTIILLASIIIWALGYFPTNISYEKNYDQMIEQAGENQELITKIQLEKESERQEKSYIGRLGHTIEPLLAPCGFDWKMSVSLITGLAAKEIVVSSMGILYHADANADESSQSLISNLQKETYKSGDRVGEKVFTPLVAFCFMLFILIYFPCIATIVAIKKESNWKWALFTMFYTTLLAWFISFSVYQLFS